MRRIKKKKISLKLKIYVVCILLVISGGVAFFMSPYGKATIQGVQNAYDKVMDKAHLVLDQVDVMGNERTPLTEIHKTIELKQGESIFNADLNEIQQKLMVLPWVKTVVVERHLPARLFIHITEKQPIAIWQNNKQYFPLDEMGNMINDSNNLPVDLILVVGKDAREHIVPLIEVLKKYSVVNSRVRSAVRYGNRRWNLILNDVDGIEVKLPETKIEEALERLQDAIENEKILKRDLASIDLRQSDRLIVSLKEGKK